jgi:hypothetical protein
MAQNTVHCAFHPNSLNVTAGHVDGQQLSFTIAPNKALVDDSGLIHYFSVNWKEQGIQDYILHPYTKHTKRHKEGIAVSDFLAGYGLSKVRGKFFKLPKGSHPALEEILDIATYMATYFGRRAITHYLDEVTAEKHVGYFNIKSEKLIFVDALYIQ